MIPLLEQELVDRRRWLSRETFLDQLALSQSMPGVLAVNMAAGVGYRLKGVKGATVAIVGNVIAPIVFILLLAMFFRQFRDNVWVQRIFMGIRPAVVALIAAPVFSLAKSAKVNWTNCWIPLVAALLIWLMGVSPMVIIMVAAVGGWVYGCIKRRRK